MTRSVTPAEVRLELIARREIALIDLRQEGPFALAHPLFASQMALGRIEMEVFDRIPRCDVTVVLYDDGEGLTDPAARLLADLGYTDVRILEAGLKGWRAAGYELFKDVNSYSKAFGELVEQRRHTPSLSAEEVQALIKDGANMVILDARRFDEYQVMNIPGSVSVPGAELVLRARTLAPNPDTLIVINCAGRTRSLIGTQSLVNAGLPNPIAALRNGTIGWTLAGQSLEHSQRRSGGEPSSQDADDARARARTVSLRAGVKRIDPAGLENLVADARRTLYRFDVRTPEEYVSGHIPGFLSAPGGQLLQETDIFAPVRGARFVLADDQGVRADMSASWLAQLGCEVYVLDGGFDGPLETGPRRPQLPPFPATVTISPDRLAEQLDRSTTLILDLAPSPIHRRGHIPGAWFAIRERIAEARLPAASKIVLTSPDGTLARFASNEVIRTLDRQVQVLDGGNAAWTAAGYPLETGIVRAACEPDDVYKRPYEGVDNNHGAMQAYLDWEYGLVEQLARDGTHGFFVI
jgi:rhodanese-related sulfurtransferase